MQKGKNYNGFQLGEILSKLARINRDYAEDWEIGRQMGAPMSELAPIINQGFEKALSRPLVLAGLSPDDLIAEIKDRMGEAASKWLFFECPELPSIEAYEEALEIQQHLRKSLSKGRY